MTARTRLVVAISLGVLVVAAGVALERRVGPRALPAAAPGPAISGAWYCPHGGGEGWRAWVVLANAGDEPVDVRVTTSVGGAPPQIADERLEPSTARHIEVGAPLPGSATALESFGGEIAASMVMAAPDGGTAAEPCAPEGRTRWFLPELSTLRGEEARLVVHNPFAAEAVIRVSLVAGDRLLRPGRLQGIVLAPRQSRAVSLQKFALGVDALGATVDVPLGRVAVAGVTVSRTGVRASVGVPEATATRLIPGVGTEGHVVVRAPERAEVPFHAELNGPEGAVRLIDLEAVPAGAAEAFPAADADGGLVLGVDGERTMITGRRMALAPPDPAPSEEDRRGGDRRQRGGDNRGGGPGGREKERPPPEPPSRDLASSGGVARPGSRWIALPALGPDGGQGAVLLQNPEVGPVDVVVTFLGPDGPVGEQQSITVPGASTVQVPLPAGPPPAAVVDAGERPIVAAQAATAADAFAVAVGVRLD